MVLVDVDLGNNEISNSDILDIKQVKLEDGSILNVYIKKTFNDYFLELVMCFFKCLVFFLTPLFLLFVCYSVFHVPVTNYL